MTLEEFLAWNDRQPGRWEFHNGRPLPKDEPVFDEAGRIVAMTGASPRHSRLATRLAGFLNRALPPGCEADTNVVLEIPPEIGSYFECDVGVSCRPQRDPRFYREPVMLAEILSPTTRDRDLAVKAPIYRQIPTLQALLFIEQDVCSMTLERRLGDQGWLLPFRPAGPGAVLELPFGMGLSVDTLYAGLFEGPTDVTEAP